MVPNLGPPDVLRLQLPEAFATTSAGQDFWELKSQKVNFRTMLERKGKRHSNRGQKHLSILVHRIKEKRRRMGEKTGCWWFWS